MEWKERAMQAEAEVMRLGQELHLLHNLLLERGIGIPSADGSKPIDASARPAEKVAINGFTDAGYALLKARLLSDPAVLAALDAARPELVVEISRPRFEIDGSSVKGRIARLIHEKFFDSPKRQADVLREFRRRGWLDAKAGNAVVIRPMADVTEMGFLTIEAEGYQIAPGAKISMKEI